ncbi:MAG: hypothetical protein ACYC6G_18890 [Desulfobaccales bacterium]
MPELGFEMTYRTYFKTYLKAQNMSSAGKKLGRQAKSLPSKGGFSRIIKRLFNPPCPPLEKGGDSPSAYTPWLIQNYAGIRF